MTSKSIIEAAADLDKGASRAVKGGARRGGTMGSRTERAIAGEASAETLAIARQSWADFRLLSRIQDNAVRALVEQQIVRAIDRTRKAAAGTSLAFLTDRDWASIGGKLTQIRTSKRVLDYGSKLDRPGRISILSGHFREVTTLHMVEMQEYADRAIFRLAMEASGKPGAVVIDSSIHGIVELATTAGRGHALGPDRMIGTVFDRAPERMKFFKADDTPDWQPIWGLFKGGHVTEIKGRSNVVDAVLQHKNLPQRSGPRYVSLGGRGYELELNPAKVERLIVVPEGSERIGQAIEAAKRLEGQMTIKFYQYPEVFEDDLQQLTRKLLVELASP